MSAPSGCRLTRLACGAVDISTGIGCTLAVKTQHGGRYHQPIHEFYGNENMTWHSNYFDFIEIND